jgi:hypothetical protein
MMKLVASLVMTFCLFGCVGETRTLKRCNQITFASITFNIPVDSQEGAMFRHSLIRLAETKQLRHGPIGVGADVFGSAEYNVQIVGLCEGAIADLGQEIIQQTKDFPDQHALVQSYFASAACEVKHRTF